MNRRVALSILATAGAAAAGSAAADPAARGTLPPAVTLAEAIRLAEAHVRAEKIETAGKFLSSAQFLRAEGNARWEVRWDGTDPLVKGDWFIIRVGMDKGAETVHGL